MSYRCVTEYLDNVLGGSLVYTWPIQTVFSAGGWRLSAERDCVALPGCIPKDGALSKSGL